MNDGMLRHYIIFNQVTPGRAEYGLNGTEAKLADLADPPLRLPALIERARGMARTNRELERRWVRQRTTPPVLPATDLKRIDKLTDTTVVAIHGALQLPLTLPADDPARLAAEEALREHFPRGQTDVIDLDPEDQLHACVDLHAWLTAPERAETTADLGLRPHLRQLAQQLPQYEAALRAKPPATLTYAELRHARRDLHEAMLAVVAAILGHWPLPEDAENRTALLAPLREQHDAVAAAWRARRKPVDVNPKTGEPEPEIPEGPAEPEVPVPA